MGYIDGVQPLRGTPGSTAYVQALLKWEGRLPEGAIRFPGDNRKASGLKRSVHRLAEKIPEPTPLVELQIHVMKKDRAGLFPVDPGCASQVIELLRGDWDHYVSLCSRFN